MLIFVSRLIRNTLSIKKAVPIIARHRKKYVLRETRKKGMLKTGLSFQHPFELLYRSDDSDTLKKDLYAEDYQAPSRRQSLRALS